MGDAGRGATGRPRREPRPAAASVPFATAPDDPAGRTARARGAPIPGLPPVAGLRLGIGRVATAVVALGRWFARCLATDREAGRGFLWLPVGFVAGIGFYHALADEPAFVPVACVVVVLVAVAVAVRSRPVAGALAIGLSAVAVGALAAGIEVSLVAAPVLDRPRTETVTGFVEAVERRPRGRVRLTVRVVPDPAAPDRPVSRLKRVVVTAATGFRGDGRPAAAGDAASTAVAATAASTTAAGREAPRAGPEPAPVGREAVSAGGEPASAGRVAEPAVRERDVAPARRKVSAAAVAVGQGISFRARLAPPRAPILPGGYDPARAAYLDGVGATGFVYGRVAPADLGPPPWPLPLFAAVAGGRAGAADRIRAALPGPTGEVAAALLVGERGGIPERIEEEMRVSGLAHVLSISGLHMALVAGTVFFLVRAVLALFPASP